MYQIAIIFLVVLLLFGLAKPKCAYSANPFRGPRFSWALAIMYSALIALIISTGLYFLVPAFKNSIDVSLGMKKPEQFMPPPPVENAKMHSASLLENNSGAQRKTATKTSTDDADVNRLSIRPFSV